ncbi:MAG: hypothetical protein AB2697_23095 [Candidatus Thiodiazotropha endolucinida]
MEITLTEVRNYAVIIGIIIAIITYLTNSYFQFRNKGIENMKRFLEAHGSLFEKGCYLVENVKAMEAGTYKRDRENEVMELAFNRLLGDLEIIALLTSHRAVPKEVQIYMLGWFAQKIQPEITGEERNNIFWELAIHYIDELAKAASDYEKLSSKKRACYLKKQRLIH